MKNIIENLKKKRNELYIEKIFDILEELEDWKVDCLKLLCEAELEDRKRRQGNTIECLNVQSNY